jgi:hypothetical protein
MHDLGLFRSGLEQDLRELPFVSELLLELLEPRETRRHSLRRAR